MLELYSLFPYFLKYYSWLVLNETIQDQSVLTHVFYITILIMRNMHTHLLMLAKNGDLKRLLQNCFKERN